MVTSLSREALEQLNEFYLARIIALEEELAKSKSKSGYQYVTSHTNEQE